MRSVIFTSLLMVFVSFSVSTQQVVKLWEENPPTNNELKGDESSEDDSWITNISSPELIVYLPTQERANGKGVIICPGGAYRGLAFHREGYLFAKWLNTQGVAAFILKYRMPNKHKNVPKEDAQQAIRYVREQAALFDVQPNKVGIAGFSAGGHLAATVSNHFSTDGTSTRPDFTILFYPVITMDIPTHGGSRENLLGDAPTPHDIHAFSIEKQITVNTPPAIILLSDDDQVVLPDNSILYYQRLKANSVKASLYIFPVGGHGWAMQDDFIYNNQALDLLSAWLKGF